MATHVRYRAKRDNPPKLGPAMSNSNEDRITDLQDPLDEEEGLYAKQIVKVKGKKSKSSRRAKELRRKSTDQEGD